MFSYKLPDGNIQDMVVLNAMGELKFDPPVYEQRYNVTLRIIQDPRWSNSFKKIVDFGCGELRLMQFMRRIEHIEHIIGVDIDEQTLVTHQSRIVPLISDYLKRRQFPLCMEIFQGSLIDRVENVRKADVVTAIEVVEHLIPEVLEKVPENIFGFIQPKLAIITTPNRDYNKLFNSLNANGFRIDDHKFEWTRKEFKDWALDICSRYPNYSVSITGVGRAPPEHKKLGFVTQIAIFARNDIIGRELKTPINLDLPADPRAEVQHKEIRSIDFPFDVDERTTIQKIEDEATDYIQRVQGSERYHNRERNIHQIPMRHLIEFAETVNGTEEDVRNVLKKLNFEIENEYIILSEEYVDENTNVKACDLYEEDEDFLDYERYCGDDIDDVNNAEHQSTELNCTQDEEEIEENWD